MLIRLCLLWAIGILTICIACSSAGDSMFDKNQVYDTIGCTTYVDSSEDGGLANFWRYSDMFADIQSRTGMSINFCGMITHNGHYNGKARMIVASCESIVGQASSEGKEYFVNLDENMPMHGSFISGTAIVKGKKTSEPPEPFMSYVLVHGQNEDSRERTTIELDARAVQIISPKPGMPVGQFNFVEPRCVEPPEGQAKKIKLESLTTSNTSQSTVSTLAPTPTLIANPERVATPVLPNLVTAESPSSADVISNTESVIEGLVGHWKFDGAEGTVVIDYSPYGHHGSIVGTAEIVEGRVDNSLLLDGNADYVSIPDTSDLRLSDAQTISTWYKWSGSGANWRRLVGKGDYWNRNYGLWIRPESGMILFQIYDGNRNGCEALGKSVTFDTNWHHLAGSYNGDTFRIYLDGQLVQESNCAITPSNTDHPVTIGFASGHWEDRDNSPFDGLLDEVRIYNRTISACEVLLLANQNC